MVCRIRRQIGSRIRIKWYSTDPRIQIRAVTRHYGSGTQVLLGYGSGSWIHNFLEATSIYMQTETAHNLRLHFMALSLYRQVT
jgi:hypothetical protein